MRSIIIGEQWDYKKESNNHLWVGERGYFLFPLDFDSEDKYRDHYCDFSLFLREDCLGNNDLELSVVDYTKNFLEYLSKTSLSDGINLTMEKSKISYNNDGYVKIPLSIDKDQLLKILNIRFHILDVFGHFLGHLHKNSKDHYRCFFLLSKKKLTNIFTVESSEILMDTLGHNSIELRLSYKIYEIELIVSLNNMGNSYVLRKIRSSSEPDVRDLKKIFSILRKSKTILAYFDTSKLSIKTKEAINQLEKKGFDLKEKSEFKFKEELRSEVKRLIKKPKLSKDITKAFQI